MACVGQVQVEFREEGTREIHGWFLGLDALNGLHCRCMCLAGDSIWGIGSFVLEGTMMRVWDVDVDNGDDGAGSTTR